MAVTANQIVVRREGVRREYPVAASTRIHEGTNVYLNAAGYADDDTATGVNLFGGIAVKEVDNSSGSAGDKSVEVWYQGDFVRVGTGFAQTNVGDRIYGVDNWTVALSSTNNTFIGRISKFLSSTQVEVCIHDRIDPSNNAVANVADDTDFIFGDSNDAVMLWGTSDGANHSLVIGLGDTSQTLHVTDEDAKATNWAFGARTHPSVLIHSNTTPHLDYLLLGDHDGTQADIDCVGGTSIALKIAGTEYASLRTTGLACGAYVAAATPGTDQLTLKSTGTAPVGTGANVGHLYADFEDDDDELFWLSGTGGTATQLTT